MDGAWTPVFHAITDVSTWTIYLIGDFDQEGEADFERAWNDLEAVGVPRVTLDMSDTAFMGSAGIGCLVRARARGVEVALRGVRPAQQRLLELSGLTDAFDFVEGSACLELTG